MILLIALLALCLITAGGITGYAWGRRTGLRIGHAQGVADHVLMIRAMSDRDSQRRRHNDGLQEVFDAIDRESDLHKERADRKGGQR